MLIAGMKRHRVPLFLRCAVASVLAAGLAVSAGCAKPDPIDPASLGFQNYYLCADPNDVVPIGKRADAKECLAACESASQQLLDGNAKACWWLDGSAGLPVECRLCKTTAPVKDVFFNNWAKTLSPPGKSPSTP